MGADCGEVTIIIILIIIKIMIIILTMTRWTRQPGNAFRAAQPTAQSSPGAMSALVIRDGQVNFLIMMTFMLMRMGVMIIMTMATTMMTMISTDSMMTQAKTVPSACAT